MGNFTFRPAVRENVGLLIGLVGASGSGKTYTAMRLAAGIAGDKRFAVIDTEAGRAKHYAEMFKFDHGDLRSPFRPQSYTDAIIAADAAGYPVIVVDSASHEHAGEGGLLDWHDEELARMGGGDKNNMAAWIKPKTAHKRMVQRLLQVRAHLILCFRAEENVEIVKDATGKTVIVPKKSRNGIDGWTPVCEKTLPYELTVSLLLTADAPGVPKAIKLQEQHRALFPLDKPITEDSGVRLARWASGGAPVDWVREIRAAPSLEILAAVWARVPKAEKKALKAALDLRKADIDAETLAAEQDAAQAAEAAAEDASTPAANGAAHAQ